MKSTCCQTAEDQYKRLVDIRLSGGNPAFVRDRGRNTDRDTDYMKILKVKRASDHSERETGLLMVSVFGRSDNVV